MNAPLAYVSLGFGVARPYLFGGLDLIAFLQAVFGAELLGKHGSDERGFHVEARIGDSVVVLEASDPPHPSGSPGSVYIYVEDTDAAYARALAHGATSLASPTDKPYKERQCGIKDSYGNTWWISTALTTP
jgi:PhnB protein